MVYAIWLFCFCQFSLVVIRFEKMYKKKIIKNLPPTDVENGAILMM
jgi:hypothetical protein